MHLLQVNEDKIIKKKNRIWNNFQESLCSQNNYAKLDES